MPSRSSDASTAFSTVSGSVLPSQSWEGIILVATVTLERSIVGKKFPSWHSLNLVSGVGGPCSSVREGPEIGADHSIEPGTHHGRPVELRGIEVRASALENAVRNAFQKLHSRCQRAAKHDVRHVSHEYLLGLGVYQSGCRRRRRRTLSPSSSCAAPYGTRLQRVGGVGKPTVVAQRRVVESSDAHAPEALLPIVRWHL